LVGVLGMPIRFRCSYCNRLLGIATRKAGTETTCPHCGYTITVPVPQEAEVRTERINLDDVEEMLGNGVTEAVQPSAVAAGQAAPPPRLKTPRREAPFPPKAEAALPPRAPPINPPPSPPSKPQKSPPAMPAAAPKPPAAPAPKPPAAPKPPVSSNPDERPL